MMFLRLLAGLAAMVPAVPASAQNATPLFSSDAPLAITLTGPMSALAANRDGDSRWAATLAVTGERIPVQLSPRGITRRLKEICQFPPLRMDLPTRPTAGLFAGQRTLKLVTYCRRRDGHAQHLLLEYAAYRIYNLLTPLSFRARLANITYADPSGRALITRPGFFIEDAFHLAQRTGLERPRTGDMVPRSSLSAAHAARMAMFEYLIANLDWSMRGGPEGEGCCHNARLLQRPGQPGFVPVPYDFDFSGLVDAPYAQPPAQIPIPNVRVRNYRGYCLHNAEALAAAGEIRTKRTEIMTLLASIPGLSPGSLRKARAFLDPFWAQIATDATVRARILSNCVR
ncbi:hypothetical protein OMW55_11500 [Sphingomonas sp. BN140010]|uniref:Uncharacterized protein n=1 Tax=Sphingomonas arvum TaxID=2992113 RepID=A0ABT3JI69_9SPHN|nr:hypothetical protein [Sphingomonas sp. BN140010]MCW3798430.1 hypothetical protein [Sphingomonas sp. BN140010]